jgi:glycosyltransferase involved in cell wall biosynthesis
MIVVVPFLNEEWCLPVFLASMAAQTRPPDRLVLVDDGSTDRSGELADEFVRSTPWAVALHRPARPPSRDRLAQANELKAFQWAVEQLDLDWDVVAKMDADLELAPSTLETVERGLRSDRGLGMAGVRLSELGEDGTRAILVSPHDHVEGATKFYRRECWSQIAPIPPILGWDTLDEIHARLNGWRTESFVVPGGDPVHLRWMGTHGSILRSFRRWGVCSFGYGSHPLHVLFYGLKLMSRRKPRVIGGLNYYAGWALAVARGAPRAGPELRRAVRREELVKARRRLTGRQRSELRTRAGSPPPASTEGNGVGAHNFTDSELTAPALAAPMPSGAVAATVARLPVAVPLMLLAALAAGVVAGHQPRVAEAAVAAAAVLVLAFRAPAIALTAQLLLTVVVPYGVQNPSGASGVSNPKLLPSDVLLFATLAWALVALARQPVTRRQFKFALAVVAFLAVVALQFVHGLMAGHDISTAGQEARVLLGFGTFLIALPLLSRPRDRRQLLIGLTVVGIALGAWGLIQWFGHISFGAAGDVGIRNGVRLTTAGSGQLQGGEYGFPVAVVMAFSVLVARGRQSPWLRVALVAVLVLNAFALLVTFERTFWLDAALGCALVVIRLSSPALVRVLIAAPFTIAIASAVLSVLAPRELTTATERLLSIGQYSTDNAVRYRLVESDFVLQQIRAHPVTGSGLAGTIYWGQPWAQVPPKSQTFSHDGYLWLAWKLGVPGAALLVLMIGWAIIPRGPPRLDRFEAALRRGAQAALAGLLLATVTFPSFSALSITSLMGTLLALATLSHPFRTRRLVPAAVVRSRPSVVAA